MPSKRKKNEARKAKKKRGGEKAKSKSQDCCVTLLSAHARTLQADILHLDQKAAKCTTCKPLDKLQNTFFSIISRSEWVNLSGNLDRFYINLASVENLENFENQISILLPFINDYTPDVFLQTVQNHIFVSKSGTLH